MTDTIPAEVFPPGDFIKEELQERGWTQVDLAEIIDSPPRLVSEVISGKRSITSQTAQKLGEAFGTSAIVWLNLENIFQLNRSKAVVEGVAKRARLFKKAPVREMVNRGWIEATADAEVLEQRILEFFEIKSLGEWPELWPHAARKSTSYLNVTPAQWSWLFRAKRLSRCVPCGAFSDKSLAAAFPKLRQCLPNPTETGQVSKILAAAGVRLVVVEHLKGTKIDGATFWVDGSPVIALSMRFDRIDYFWHTLFHELGHVTERDGLKSRVPFDVDLRQFQKGQRPKFEERADEFAVNSLVPQNKLTQFIRRSGPLYRTNKIADFAKLAGVHPGIVVGQLQQREKIPYAHSRKLLVKVRSYVTEASVTDGWGIMAPQNI